MTIAEQQAGLRAKLEQSGISDPGVLEVMETTRRDRFVPDDLKSSAYEDIALPIGADQTISQPYIVALMTEALGLKGNELVLEVGTGSGYQAAVLSRLCREVVTIERLDELSAPARQVLAELGYANIDFRTGDGTLGCPDRAPFDAVVVTAAAPDVPAPLFNQLKMGGRLVVPVGDEASQRLIAVTKMEPEPAIRYLCGCRFVKLIGDAGWPAE